MKKRLAAVVCAMVLTFGLSTNVMAAISPTGTPEEPGKPDEPDEAPTTGESNLLIYGAAMAALLTGTAVISRKRLETLK